MTKDVLTIATRQSGADANKLQEILDLIHAQGNTFWVNAEEFLAEGYDHSIFFIERCNSGFDLNGDIYGDDGEYTLVSFEDWHRQVKEFLVGYTQPEVTIETAAFLTKDVSLNQLQVLIEIAHNADNTFWSSADDFLRWIDGDEHVTYFAERSGIDGTDGGLQGDLVLVSYDKFLELFINHYEAASVEPPKRNPHPRYRLRKRQKPTVAKTIVRVLYTTQQTYTLKNVRSVQIIDDKVFVQYTREVTEGIVENAEVEIDGNLVMAVVIHEVGNRANFFRNIDGSWDFQNEDGTVINSGKQLGRIFK